MALPAALHTTTDTDESLAFLRSLYHGAPAGWIELRSIAPDKSGHVVVDWFKTGDWAALARTAAQRNAAGRGVYLGVGLRKARKAHGGGNKGDVTYITALWADADAKDFGGDLDAARRAIEAERPSIVIFSGAGYHGYWLFNEPLEVNDTNRRDIERTLKGLAKVCSGDSAVAEMARVMRLPGSINTKPGRNNARCKIVSITSQRFNFSDLCLEYMPLAMPKPRPATIFSAGADASEVERALGFIPDTIPYGDWQRVLAGLTHSLGPSDALALAERWTHDDAPGGLAGRIASFKPDYSGTAATVGTIFHIAKQYGYQPPAREVDLKPVRVIAPDAPRAELPPVEESDVQPLTFCWNKLYMPVCADYIVIHKAVLELGTPDNFTVASVAAHIGKSDDATREMFKKAQALELIDYATAKFTRKEDNYLRVKNAVQAYCLTPTRGIDNVLEKLPGELMRIMGRATPAKILQVDAVEGGFDEARAAQIELTSAETVRTKRAQKLQDAAEDAAYEMANKLQRDALNDDTPFVSDTVLSSVSELRVAMIEHQWATDPDKVWQQRELIYAAGVKQDSISGLIKKSTKIQPAPNPTFQNVMLDVGLSPEETFRAATKAARKEGGAPCAWVDIRGEVIAPFSREVPAGARGVKLNMGKKYVRRVAESVEAAEPTPAPTETAVTEPTPEEQEQLKAERAKRRARADILPSLRGCLKARGWSYMPGPYGFWERDGVKAENTLEAMADALLMDYEWAKAQRQRREETERANNPMFAIVAEHGGTLRRREGELQSA